MEVLYPICGSIDVHKKQVTACVRVSKGVKAEHEVRQFGTFTGDLLSLSDWFSECGVTCVAMESTGSYWRPVYTILEGQFELVVANAHHIKNVPGRKTDTKDAVWISDLLAHGLLKASFVPPQPQRALRDLTRARSGFVGERARLSNRIQKLLEESNIKLASVATDVLGVSGRAMLHAISEGQDDAVALAQLARKSLKKKTTELEGALKGRIQPYQRVVLGELLRQVESLDGSISRLEDAIGKAIQGGPEYPFDEAAALIDTAPGASTTAARAVIAEIGTDMKAFGSSGRLCAWAGTAPGNHQSAGKRLSGKTLHGNRALKTLLVEIANAASRQNGSYCQALYRRIAARRGRKRALLAVANSLLKAFYHMLLNRVPYQDLGGDYFDRINKSSLVKGLTKRLANLGYDVTIKEAA
jgi:transposase